MGVLIAFPGRARARTVNLAEPAQPDVAWWAVAEDWTGSARQWIEPIMSRECPPVTAEFRHASIHTAGPRYRLLEFWRRRSLVVPDGLPVFPVEGARMDGDRLSVERGGVIVLPL